MKKLGMFLMLVVAMAIAMPTSYAQLSRREIKTIEKNAKKEAKKLKKDGWKVAPGNTAMEIQLAESYKLQMQKDEDGYDKYLQGEAMTVGQMYDAALFQAESMAKVSLAGKLETRVVQIIDNKLANEQISEEDAVSLVKSVSSGKNLIAKKMGQVVVPVKLYRNLDNGNVEVRVVAYYSQAMALKVAKEAMRAELEKEADGLAGRVDGVLN